jgi:hypothetical protein
MAIEDLGWHENRGWFTYPFNLGRHEPAVGEIHSFQGACVKIELIQNHSFLYQISQKDETCIGKSHHTFGGRTVLFCSVNPNPGHFLSEIISFAEFYNSLGQPTRVALPHALQEKLPFMYQVLRDLCPGIRLIPLGNKIQYRFEQLLTRRNRWFTYLRNWSDIPYVQCKSMLHFANLQDISGFHTDPLDRLLNYVCNIYSDNHHAVKRSKKLFIVKTTEDCNSISPGRGLTIDIASKQLAMERGFEFISISEFKDHIEYVSTLRRATHIVFSYGAITCANRFFLSPSAAVVLLANLSYAGEYTIGDSYWHIRHSHLCPVSSQSVIMDFPDIVTECSMRIVLDEIDRI